MKYKILNDTTTGIEIQCCRKINLHLSEPNSFMNNRILNPAFLYSSCTPFQLNQCKDSVTWYSTTIMMWKLDINTTDEPCSVSPGIVRWGQQVYNGEAHMCIYIYSNGLASRQYDYTTYITEFPTRTKKKQPESNLKHIFVFFGILL